MLLKQALALRTGPYVIVELVIKNGQLIVAKQHLIKRYKQHKHLDH